MAELANAHGLLTTICCCYGDYPLAKALFRYIRKYRFPQHLQTLCPNWQAIAERLVLPPAERACGLLRPEMQEVLANSRFLIVLCTDHSIKDDEGREYLSTCISYFLQHQPHSSGKEIIPILCRESGAIRAKECLLPELGEMNLLAPDILIKGHRHVFSDVVATLAGVEPDLLWDRKRQKHTSRLRRHLLKCGVVFGIVPLAFCYKHWQTETQLYADYTFRDGEPVGVCPVNESEAARMHRYFRLTSSFGNFQKLEQCDSSGHVSDDDDCLYGYARPAVIDIEQAEDKRLIFRNAAGEELRTLSFRRAEDVYLFRHDIYPVSSFPELMTDSLCGSQLSADGKLVFFKQHKDEHGYLTEAQFRHADGTPLRGNVHDLVVQLIRNPAAEYRVSELCTEIAPPETISDEKVSVISDSKARVQKFLKTRRKQALEEEPEVASEPADMPNTNCVRACRYLYRLVVNRTLLSERVLQHEKDQGDQAECRTQFFWNSNLNLVMELVYNNQARCVRRTVYDYDVNGKRYSVKHFSWRNEPILHDGWHEKRYRYTKDGRALDCEFYGVQGEPVTPNRKESSHES